MDDVQIVSPGGENLLRNGNFSRGLDHWHFTSDEHLEWHIKQVVLAILFDQGACGLCIIALMVLVASARTGYGAWYGDIAHAEILASLAAFLAVGLFDSLIDSPRFLFLFIAIGWLGLTLEVPRRQLVSAAVSGSTSL